VKRILLTVEYDGTLYAGWQRQQNALSVQQVLEEALSRACAHPVTATGSSRTDAGVHALAQMVHFDSDCTIPPEKYAFVLNTMLPPDIRVQASREVPDAFHARFLSCGKTYTYRMLNTRHASALRRNTHWHIPVPLDESLMREALLALPGSHDFAAFQAAGGTAKTTMRTIFSADLIRETPFPLAASDPSEEDITVSRPRMSARSFADPDQKGSSYTLILSGNAFLYNMVRIVAGTLMEVGLGKRSPDAFSQAFRSLDRLDLGMTAPPHGLTLAEVRYPPEAFTNPEIIRWHQEVTDP